MRKTPAKDKEGGAGEEETGQGIGELAAGPPASHKGWIHSQGTEKPVGTLSRAASCGVSTNMYVRVHICGCMCVYMCCVHMCAGVVCASKEAAVGGCGASLG